MKKLVLVLALLLTCNVSNAKCVNYINCMPKDIMTYYQEELTLPILEQKTLDFDDVLITKIKYKLQYAYKLGNGYEYVITNKSANDVVLKGVKGDYFANKDITNKSHWTRMSVRAFKYWQTYAYRFDFALNSDKEKNNFWADFPRDVIIKPDESLKLRALGLTLKEEQNLKFIFGNKEIDF